MYFDIIIIEFLGEYQDLNSLKTLFKSKYF
jgi:hypothetical protein